MKKVMQPAVIALTIFGLFSCKNNTEKNSELKDPVEVSTTTNATTSLTPEAAKAKTIENMQAAYKGETNASARYAAFAKKAEEEGYHQIAVLFKAASMAEGIHAQNHKVVLEEMGVQVNPVTPEVVVKSTKENLEYAIKGEAYEVKEMYPEFLTTAEKAGNQLALISLNYAYKTEKKHEALYKKALEALNSNTVNTLASVYYVCPTCGNTVENQQPKRCDISMTNGDKFTKVF